MTCRSRSGTEGIVVTGDDGDLMTEAGWGFSLVLGFAKENGLGSATVSLPLGRDALRPPASRPFRHMKRRSCHVGEVGVAVMVLSVSGEDGVAVMVFSVSVGEELEMSEDCDMERGLYAVCLRNMVVVLRWFWWEVAGITVIASG